MANWIQDLLGGTNISVLVLAIVVILRYNGELSREKTLRRNYPPHLHVGKGRIIFPKEYPGPDIEQYNLDPFDR